MPQTQAHTQALIFLGHGSRDPLWQRPFELLQQRCQAAVPQVLALTAYLEHTPPSLPQAMQSCANQGIQQVKVVPVFMGFGNHLRLDLPRLIEAAQSQHPQLNITLTSFIGEWPSVLDAIVHEAVRG